jgi:hypothetical protein
LKQAEVARVVGSGVEEGDLTLSHGEIVLHTSFGYNAELVEGCAF